MKSRKTKFRKVSLSLKDFTGLDYINSVCAARACLTGEDKNEIKKHACEKIEFFPQSFQNRLTELLPKIGLTCCPPIKSTPQGATTSEFQSHSKTDSAPLSGLGYYRLAENGILYLISKSEHYHAPLGHQFPGYALIERARSLGVPNATHNNTRGYITRILEEELVRVASGIPRNYPNRLSRLLASKNKSALNQVINLETGSLAAEAALKMILSRFYKPQEDSPNPKYRNKIPVILVIGDENSGLQANYHGTTVITQTMRGMWSDLLKRLEKQGILCVRSIRPNNLDDLNSAFAAYESKRYKIAGFFYELILMNYGAKRLTETICQTNPYPLQQTRRPYGCR